MDRQPRRESFFFALSTLMFLVVVVGFSRTLYFRPFTDVQDMTGRGIPWHLIVHGLVMTAWFAFVVAQTWLVRTHQVATHRRFGWFGAALGGAVIATGLYTIAKFAPRAASTQFDPARAADIVVGNALGRLHPASIWGGLVLLVGLILPLPISRTSAGAAFVQWVMANT